MMYAPDHAIAELQAAGFSCDYDTTGGGCMAIVIPCGYDYILITDSEGPFNGWADEVQSESFAVGRYQGKGDWFTNEIGQVDGNFLPVTMDNLVTVVGNLAAIDIVWPK